MSSLGELYFQLGLDDKRFNDAIEAAKQKVKELGADVGIGVKLDLDALKKEIQNAAKVAGGGSLEIGAKVKADGLENLYSMLEASKKEAKELEEAIAKTTAASVKVQKQAELDSVRKRIADQEAKILAKGGSLDTPKSTIVKVELDEESINQVKARLAQLESPITPKVSIEYDQEKFRAVATTLENYTKRLNELGTVRLGIDDSFIRTGVGQNKKGLNGWLSNVSDYLLGDDTGDAGKSIKSIQKILDNYTFKVKAEVDAQKLVASISGAVKKVPVDINVDVEAVKKKLKQLGVPLNFNMNQAIADAKANLKKHEFKAKLNLVIDKAKVSKAIKEAFAKKGLEYQASPSDVRNARILEIQQRMEQRQKKFDGQVKKSNTSMKKLGSSTRNASDWAGQLSNQFNNLVSFYALERFIRNLYTIGGEFQKQQIALQNMIGDVDRGNAIFERMKDLAVKSPFTFSDLASYTKQMSAYGIEYENLYDTTKRLADISAGVGVDMGRLILAFGQVRSAAVLRGQELRQFTEAGIPLVAELAKKFTELEGRVVSTGEVFDKISKREVTFGMVKDILFDMTDPGGRFFETQEKLAESLAGKWSNLKDAWDIMIADIANGNNSVLSGLADIINSLIRGFETWLPFVSGAVVALGLLRGAITAVNIVSTANPWVLIGSVMAGVVSTIISLASETETATELITRLNRELEGAVAQNNDNERNANRYLDILKKQADSESDKYALYQKQKAAFEELLKLYPKATEIAELELMTLEEIEKTRKRIAEQTKKDNLNQYDVRIDEAYDAYEKKRIETEKILRDSGKTIEDFPETKKELEALYNLYTNAMNAKEMYEQSFIDAARPKPLADWQIKADEIIAKYPNIAALKRDKGDDIWAYFDFLEATFKEAKEKYDRATSESMKKPYKAIMDAVNAVNMGIGGVSLYDSKKKKGGKTPAEEAAERDAKAYLDTLKAKLSELASQWDLYKDLFEATGDKRLSMNIAFDGVMPNFDNYISHLKGLMQEEIQKRGLGISVADLLSEGKEGIAKRVNDKSQTAWTEDVAKNLNAIIDSYNNTNKKLREESVRNFIDIIKNSKDFAQQIADIDRELQKDLSDLAKMSGGTDSELYNRRVEELIKRAEEEKTKVNFEEFKKSSDWVKVFDDLDRVSDATLDNMISKIEEFAKQAHLSEEVTKQLVDAMGKLRKESIERNPLQGFKDAWGRLKYLKSGVVTKSGMIRYGSGTNEDPFTFKSKKEVDDGVAEANDDLKDSALAVADKFQAVANAADLLDGIFSEFGVNLGGLSDALGNIANGATTGAGVANAFGAAGPWGAIVGAAVGMMSSILNANDRKMDRLIELAETRRKISENISNNLEMSLDRMMGGIYQLKLDDETKSYLNNVVGGNEEYLKALSDYKNGLDGGFDTLKTLAKGNNYSEDTINSILETLKEDSYFDAQLANLKIQRDDVRKQLEAEQGKGKDKSEDKIESYKQELKELEDSIRYFAEDMANALYSIDFKDWASQLTDSIVNAWASGEDAVKAYENTVSDIMRNVAAKMAQQSIIEKYMNDFLAPFLDEFTAKNGIMDSEMYSELANIVDGTGERIEQVQDFLEQLEDVMNEKGLTLKDTSDSSSSGLSKGIQSVTEDTANLLGSYLNSIRQDSSVQRNLIEQLVSVDVPKINYLAEAQLRELSQIQSNTARNVVLVGEIRDLFNKVVDKGSNKLKV